MNSVIQLRPPQSEKPTVRGGRAKNAAYRQREYLTEAEIDKLLAAANPVRDRLLILMAFRHALRVSELVTLRWQQIHLDTAQGNGFDARANPPHRLPPTRVEPAPRLGMDLASGEIKAIICRRSGASLVVCEAQPIRSKPVFPGDARRSGRRRGGRRAGARADAAYGRDPSHRDSGSRTRSLSADRAAKATRPSERSAGVCD